MKSVLILAAALMALAACSPPDLEDDTHNTFVLVHGASGGGWDWRTVDNLLSADGHTVYRPTLTGLGERMHLSTPNVDLTTHIDDITNVILFENLDGRKCHLKDRW
jgi:esterase/lipase